MKDSSRSGSEKASNLPHTLELNPGVGIEFTGSLQKPVWSSLITEIYYDDSVDFDYQWRPIIKSYAWSLQNTHVRAVDEAPAVLLI